MHTPQDIDDAREYDTRMQRNCNPIASEVILTQYKRTRRSAVLNADEIRTHHLTTLTR